MDLLLRIARNERSGGRTRTGSKNMKLFIRHKMFLSALPIFEILIFEPFSHIDRTHECAISYPELELYSIKLRHKQVVGYDIATFVVRAVHRNRPAVDLERQLVCSSYIVHVLKLVHMNYNPAWLCQWSECESLLHMPCTQTTDHFLFWRHIVTLLCMNI